MPSDAIDLREAFANQKPEPFPLTPNLWLLDGHVEGHPVGLGYDSSDRWLVSLEENSRG